jgi:hypothetical protein
MDAEESIFEELVPAQLVDARKVPLVKPVET